MAVGDLRADEVAGLAWSGNPAHLRSVAAALKWAARGLEDYLVARAPTGDPVALTEAIDAAYRGEALHYEP